MFHHRERRDIRTLSMCSVISVVRRARVLTPARVPIPHRCGAQQRERADHRDERQLACRPSNCVRAGRPDAASLDAVLLESARVAAAHSRQRESTVWLSRSMRPRFVPPACRQLHAQRRCRVQPAARVRLKQHETSRRYSSVRSSSFAPALSARAGWRLRRDDGPAPWDR